MSTARKTAMRPLDHYVLGMHEFVEVPLKNIVIDAAYQRDINQQQVQRIVNQFTPDRFEPITVNLRTNGKAKTYAAVDGQHRLAAAHKLGFKTITCRALAVDAATEAELFVTLNRNRIWVNPVQRFKAELAAANPAAMEIRDLLAARDLRIAGPPQATDAIAAVTALQKIYARAGAYGLARVIDTIVVCWDQETSKRFAGDILLGLDTFYEGAGRAAVAVVAERLTFTTPVQLMAKASQRWYGYKAIGQTHKSVVDCIGDEILRAYRKRGLAVAA